MISVADREANGLELMRDAHCDHLITATAYYQHKGGHFFIFPLAEQGNLWEFWTKKENIPIHDRPYLTWVFAQLTGLAQGIEKLHHPSSSQTRSNKSGSKSKENNDHSYSSDNSCRHGDLKPENILCFKAKQKCGIRGNGIPDVRLVITDVGLAKTHNNATKYRPSTNTTVSTKRYLAPEMEVNPEGSLGRRFDIWSMGCLFLEFTIWLLYGAGELERCTAEISEFFEIHETSKTETKSDKHLKLPTPTSAKKKWARRHPVVDGWIDYLKEDWRCSEKTALGKLVKLIDKWMLVVEVEELEAPPSLQRQTTSLKKETSRVAQPADYSRKQGYRTYAPAMVKDLEEILTGLQESSIDAIATKPHAGADTRRGPSKVTSRTKGGTPSVVVVRPV
jgi:serine/threonine protein kinase